MLGNWILYGEQLLEKEEDFKLVNCREWCVIPAVQELIRTKIKIAYRTKYLRVLA